MVYQIDVNQAKNKQFLQMVELMSDLGVIKSISPENGTASYDTSLSDEELLRNAIKEGLDSGFVEDFDPDLLLESLHKKHGIQ